MLFSDFEHNFKKLEETFEQEKSDEKAVVLCNCKKTFKNENAVSLYKGQTCAIIAATYNSVNDCRYSCIGLGDCVKVCPQEAIFIRNGTALISELCSGCGKCISYCPKNLIKLVSKDTKEVILCSNNIQPLTSCTSYQKQEKLEWPEKKDYKIWKSFYKILNNNQ